jgi:regulator of replication initiation timing
VANEPNQESYVRRVLEETREYERRLREDNEGLRELVATLECERLALHKRVEELEAGATQQMNELSALRERLTAQVNANQKSTEQQLAIEQQNTNLANLYVASYRLNGALDRTELVDAIREIVINLVGCEEFALLEPDGHGGWQVCDSMGLPADFLTSMTHPDGALAGHLRSRQMHVTDPAVLSVDELDVSRPSASIVMSVGDETVGAVAMYRLLPQKSGLEPLDRELFDLLAANAAMALYRLKLQEYVKSAK